MPRGVFTRIAPEPEPSIDWAPLIEWTGSVWLGTPEALGTDVKKSFECHTFLKFQSESAEEQIEELLIRARDLQDQAFDETSEKRLAFLDHKIQLLAKRIERLRTAR